MAHYHLETNDDGSIRRVLRDGEPNPASVSLEQLFSIVTLYFKVAGSNLQLLEKEDSKPLRRAYGVQAFIMSLTGVEAFTNTYFKLRGDELADPRLAQRVGKRHGSVTRKIEELLAMTPEGTIEDQATIIARVARTFSPPEHARPSAMGAGVDDLGRDRPGDDRGTRP